MTSEQILTLVFSILGGAGLIGGFLYWHFKIINGFKDDIHKIEIKFKELEHKDELQQQTINQLSDLLPVLKTILENLSKKS